MSNSPEFFIAGGPKCGTTALWEYLRHHPSVYLPYIKEPHYYAKDLGAFRTLKDRNAYISLFKDASADQLCGEASVFYLHSGEALQNISREHPEARIIMMVRNPVEVVHSLHAQLLYTTNEDVKDFDKAWGLQEARAKGKEIPETCTSPAVLQYLEVASFGKQYQKLNSLFPESQIKLIRFIDFKSNTASVYRDVLQFLGLKDDGRSDFGVVNKHKTPKSEKVARFINRPPEPLKKAVLTVKDWLGIERLGILEKAEKLNRKPSQRKGLHQERKKELYSEFSEDIKLLEECTGLDFSHWKY